jgi:anti-sigma factor RsiW
MGRPAACRRHGFALVAHVYGEPHRDRARLLVHLRGCAACRREAAELRAVRDALGALPALSALPGPGVREGTGFSAGRPWLARILPAAAVLLIACLAFGGKTSLVPERLSLPNESIFGASALVSCRTFAGHELDRRLDWVAGAIAGLGGDPW